MKDLRRVGPGADLDRIRQGLEGLAGERAELDIKPLRGQSPWFRLRIGEYRILYRLIDAREAGGASHLVARIVPRGDLERAVSTLK